MAVVWNIWRFQSQIKLNKTGSILPFCWVTRQEVSGLGGGVWKVKNKNARLWIYEFEIVVLYGEYAKAKECLEKAFVLERKYGNSEHESICHLLLSILMFKEGNISESKSNAFVSFNRAEVIRRLQVHDKLSTKKQKLSTFRLISYLKNPFIIFTKSTFFRPCLVTYG